MERIIIDDRKSIIINGATKVISTTQTQAIVEIEDTNLLVSGTNIEVTKLDLNNKEVEFAGIINSVKYLSKTEKTPILKRIFK